MVRKQSQLEVNIIINFQMVESKSQNFIQQEKEFEKFKSNLSTIISSFEKAKEWADLSNCLQRVKKTFDQFPNLPVPLKKELAKRLAQCLNPDLSVIHLLTLEVYEQVFARELALTNQNPDGKKLFGADLALFYSGLFSFYQNAAFEVKKFFIQLIEQKVLPFERELIICLPGFMVCMLPALEEQNSEQLKSIERVLLLTEKIVGTSKFFGEIWKTIIRSPRCRLAAIKYLDRKIPKDIEAAQRLMGNEGTKCVNLAQYGLVVREGKLIVEEKIKGNYKDQAKFEIEDNTMKNKLKSSKFEESQEAYFYFFYPNKEQLVIQALLAGLTIGAGNENYANRATLDFLISHFPITSKLLNPEERIQLVEGCMLTLPKKDFATQKKFFTWFLGHLEDDTNPQEDDPAIIAAVEALKNILNNFKDLKQQKSEDASQGQAIHKTLWAASQNTPITIYTNFLDSSSIQSPILNKTSVDLIIYIKYYYDKQDLNQNNFQSKVETFFDMIKDHMNCVWTALGSQLSKEIRDPLGNKIEAVTLITFFLKNLNLRDKAITTENVQKLLRTSTLIEDEAETVNEQIIQNQTFHKMVSPIFSNLLSGVEKISNDLQNLDQVNAALDLIGEIMKLMEKHRIQNQENLDMVNEAIQKFNKFYIKMCNSNESDFNRKNQIDTLKKASYILFEVQRYADPTSLEIMPDWLRKIIECSCNKKRGQTLILISVDVFLKVIENQVQPGNLAKLNKLVKPKKCMEVIKTLWSLLDESSDHDQIVHLLKQFDMCLPRIFSDVVTAELGSKDRGVKYRAVNKFSIFWKLTAKDYPNYKPFQPIEFRNYKEGQFINQILDVADSDLSDAISGRMYTALHNMLYILDDDDPTLRLACRSWLTESKSSFLRILDPILNEFLDNNRVYRSFSGQIFFLESYEPKVGIENFKKLRNIILNTQSEFIDYIISNNVSDYIALPFQQQFSYIQAEHELKYMQRKYIQAIVYITLQSIVGQAVESLGSRLYQELQTVNASACEFLEQIMKSIQSKTNLTIEIAHLIINPLVKALRQAIDNKNNAQQVHLLNLLQVIVIESKSFLPRQDEKKDEQLTKFAKNAQSLFVNMDFIKCIVDGMQSSQAFVRYHHINFSNKIVYFMHQNIESHDRIKFIEKLVTCFCDLLKQADVSQYSIRDKRFSENGIAQNFGDSSVNSQKIVINQENDIAQIIDGLKKIINSCLEIPQDHNSDDDQAQRPKQTVQESAEPQKKGFLFGLIGNSKKEEVKSSRIHSMILDDHMVQILLSVVNCWNSLDCFSGSENHFTRLGVFPYNQKNESDMRSNIEKQKLEIFNKNNGINMTDESEIMLRKHDTNSEIVGDGYNSKSTISHEEYLRSHFNVIQTHIVNFLQPIAQRFTMSVVKAFLQIWGWRTNFESIGMNVNEGGKKIIELLLSLSLQPYQVIDAIQKYLLAENHVAVKQRNARLDKNAKERATSQSLYCHFVYNYLLHCISHHFQNNQQQPDNYIVLTDKNYELLYANMMKFFKCFIYSRSPITVSWLLEILYILTNKFKPEDQNIEKKVKADYLDVLDTLLKSATMIIQDTFGLEYKDEFGINSIPVSPTVYEMIKRYEFIRTHPNHEQKIKDMEDELLKNGIVESIRDEREKTLVGGKIVTNFNAVNKNLEFVFTDDLKKLDELVIPQGSMFEQIKIVRDPDEIYKQNHMSEFMNILIRYFHDQDQKIPKTQQEAIFKVFTIVTLRQILVPLTESLHISQQDNAKNNQFVSMSIVLNGMVKVMHDTLKDISRKNMTVFDKTIMEFQTELLAYIAGKNQLLQKNYKQEVNDIFNEEHFFKLDERILSQWQAVMSSFLNSSESEGEVQVFQEQLLRFNKMEGFFVGQKTVIDQKTVTFKRLAFLVFSNRTGEFNEAMLDGLLKKMTEGFKNQEKNEEMRQQLFLLSRILMLRLKEKQLEDVLRKLWPHLLNELVLVFDAPKDIKRSEDEVKRHLQLTKEAILIIGLMSQLNIEDFQIDQWMFLFDGYGIQYPDRELSKEVKDIDDETRVGVVNGKFAKRSKETFQPYMIQFMCKKPEGVNSAAFINGGNQDDSKQEMRDYSKQEMRFYAVNSSNNQRPDATMLGVQRDFRIIEGDRSTLGLNLDFDSKEGKPEMEQKLFAQVKAMQDALAISNTKRTEIDRNQAETEIEKAFLAKETK